MESEKQTNKPLPQKNPKQTKNKQTKKNPKQTNKQTKNNIKIKKARKTKGKNLHALTSVVSDIHVQY